MLRRMAMITLLLVVCGTAAAQGALTVKVGDITGPHRQRTEVPIEVVGASNLGSLHVELNYDPAVLTPVEARSAGLAGNASFDSNLSTSGRVVMGLVTAQGISGSGQVAVVVFEVPGQSGATSPLTLQNVEASDANTLSLVQATVQSGTFTVGAAAGGTSLMLVGLFGVILLAAVLIVWQVSKSRGGAAAPAAGPAGQLWVTAGSATPSTLALSKAVLLLGRDPGCDLVVQDDLASRQHAQIRLEGQGAVLYDLDSSNGTFVNGERISGPYRLRQGDRITLGDTELAYGQ